MHNGHKSTFANPNCSKFQRTHAFLNPKLNSIIETQYVMQFCKVLA
jgi:hypothetical protein